MTNELIPHYSGGFEVFRTPEGAQYARLQLTSGYVWFSFDLVAESYDSLDNEDYFGDLQLKQDLETAYQYLSTLAYLHNEPTS